ncbi:LysR family transcriptional regulator [Gorillibacterium massiliense]|uniref:LysR family transcriptional regulator n=1 Tax=Gorillibacterium massiliense TaxID=1280390 RepID=UPI0004BC4A57|nr:LysR family transcriptional regulator [Gorillibacterium massiliense]
MDLKGIKSFHCIVKTGSFIRAAEELNYAQSTLTMQIQKLEADVGVQLLERGKKIGMTEAGRFLYEESKDILRGMERLETDLADMQAGGAGSIRLGVTEPTASLRLPPLIKAFMDRYPKIRIALDIAGSPQLLESVRQGATDFAICSSPDVGDTLHFEPLFQEDFVVLLPDGHPLAGYARLQPQQLLDHRLLITAATCPYRKKLEILLRESQAFPTETMEIGSMTALKSYVQQGLGIALVPGISVEPLPPGLTMRAMQGESVRMLTGFVSKAEPLSQAGEKLYHFLKERLSAGQPVTYEQ